MLDPFRNKLLDLAVDSGGESSMDRFPEPRLVLSIVDMSNHGLSGREKVVSSRPKSSRCVNFFTHEYPGEKRIKRHFLEKRRVCYNISGSNYRRKSWNVQLLDIPRLTSFQANGVSSKNWSTDSRRREHFEILQVVRMGGWIVAHNL